MAALCFKRLLYGSRPFCASSSPHLLRFSTAAAENPPPATPFIAVQYLIDSCGFSPESATRVSKYVAHIKSSSNPDSVIRFLKETGLDDAQIRDVIARRPTLLVSKVDPTLTAKRRAMQELGFSESEIPRLIHLSPNTLASRSTKPSIQFWRAFHPTNESLFKAISKTPNLLGVNVESVVHNIYLLRRRCSLSEAHITRLITASPMLLARDRDSFEGLVRRVEMLGVPPRSTVFHYALQVVGTNTDSKIKSKIRLLERLGFSETAVKSAIQSFPTLLNFTEKKLRDNIHFLTNKANCEPAYVILHPELLAQSLERRLIPRHSVLKILKSKGLADGDINLLSFMTCTEKKFIENFVLPHKEEAPDLHEIYVTACAGKVAIRTKDQVEKGTKKNNGI